MSFNRLQVIYKHLLPSEENAIELQPTCGIIAYLGEQQAFPILLSGLNILESRGYDSAGLSTLSDTGEIITSKFASTNAESADALKLLAQKSDQHHQHNMGIAHTRWATHGARTNINAHPHLDSNNRITIVHNGIIDNAEQLRQTLQSTPFGHMRSQTDSEVVAQLLGHQLDTGRNMTTAFPYILSLLEGTWGLVCIDRQDPQHLWCACHGSPLVIGFGERETFVASEPSAFSQYTHEFLPLTDGEWCCLSINPDGNKWQHQRWQPIPEKVLTSSPDPYKHWTLREICEQPQSLRRAIKRGSRLHQGQAILGGLHDNKHILLPKHKNKNIDLKLLACGSSLYAAQWGVGVFRYLNTLPGVMAVDASEFGERDLTEIINRKGHPILGCISQSGETKDVSLAMTAAKRVGIPVFGVVNAVGSMIARNTLCGVYCHAGREVAVAATKSFTSQCAVLTLIALWFAQQTVSGMQQAKDAIVKALQCLPECAEQCIQDAIRNTIHIIAQEIGQHNMGSLFVIGRGMGHPIAMEGALKIKEISYIHAEGLAAGSLKHGPLALTQENTPVIAIILDDEYLSRMLSACEEVKARGGKVYAITNVPDKMTKNLFSGIVDIPDNGPLTSLNAVIPLQLLAYELSIFYKRNPDRPRNLAKSVTTD